MFLNYFDVWISKMFLKHKKYYFNIFLNKKYFKKQLQLYSQIKKKYILYYINYIRQKKVNYLPI
jgi:hypothetical protein